MKMIDAKKEIEDKLFQGAPLSLDAMLCALAALNAYIEERGSDSFVTLDVKIDEDSQVNKVATTLMCDMLSQALKTSEEKCRIDESSAQIFIDGF